MRAKLLGVDFETQHADAETCNVTEVGAILSTERFTPIEGKEVSKLCFEGMYPPQSEEVAELTGITDEMLRTTGWLPQLVFEKLLFPLVEEADYVLAYNKSFDETVYYATSQRLGLNPPRKPWICAMSEVDYPKKFRCRQLSHLAFDHRIPFDPHGLHRALDDVRLMLQVCAVYGFENILAYVNEPWVYLQAIFPAPFGATQTAGLVGKAKAQKLGYGWERVRGDPREFPKSWVRRVKSRSVEQELEQARKLELTVRVLSP